MKNVSNTEASIPPWVDNSLLTWARTVSAREANKTENILLGVLGKIRRNATNEESMATVIEEEVTTPKISVKAKLMKHGLKRVAAMNSDRTEQNTEATCK